MYLYRCARRGDFDKDCPMDPIVTGDNSFSYEEDEEYIHFFRFSKDAEFYFRRNITYIKSSNYHVGYMIVDVLENEVAKYLGYGLYDDTDYNKTPTFIDSFKQNGKKNKENRVILEYAIPKKVYNNFLNRYFFRVKDEYDETVYENMNFFERIPFEFRNNYEYDEYMEIINNLKVRYDGDSKLIGEDVVTQYMQVMNKK